MGGSPDDDGTAGPRLGSGGAVVFALFLAGIPLLVAGLPLAAGPDAAAAVPGLPAPKPAVDRLRAMEPR